MMVLVCGITITVTSCKNATKAAKDIYQKVANKENLKFGGNIAEEIIKDRD